MNWEQRDAFLEAAKPLRCYYPLFATLAKTGVRPGEAFALQLGDIDIRSRTLRVERALRLGRIKPTKTYEERTVDVTPDLLQTIQFHLTQDIPSGSPAACRCRRPCPPPPGSTSPPRRRSRATNRS